MVATKLPFGSIHEDWVKYVMPLRKDGKFYIMDTVGSQIEVEESVYNKLKEKGIPTYEGNFEKAGISQL